MQPATYASVAHVGWERSIRWEAPDDDDAAERAAPVVGAQPEEDLLAPVAIQAHEALGGDADLPLRQRGLLVQARQPTLVGATLLGLSSPSSAFRFPPRGAA